MCHNPSFIDPIVAFNPVVTPTGIATVSPNVYYFGEWNTGNLERLELTANGTVVSMSQVYTQSGGIIAVEMGPNGKLYFTSPSGIYTYDVPSLPSVVPSPVYTILGIALIIIAIGALSYLAIRYRSRNTSQAVARTQESHSGIAP
jgi:hypothetical protein